LLEVSRQLSRIQPLESLLAKMAQVCGQLLDSDSVGIRVVEGDDLVVMGSWGDARQVMSTPRLKIGESLTGIVAATGEPLVVWDPASDPRLTPAHREAYRRAGYRAFLGVPHKLGERVLGVLTIRSYREQGFSEEDLSIVSAVAAQAAVAMENARLFAEGRRAEEALRDARDRLQAIIDASQLAIITLDEHGIVKTWNRAATRLFGWREEEMLNRPLPTGPDERQGEYEALLAPREPVTELETKRRRKDGSLVDVVLSVAPITDAQGRPQGRMEVIAAVTRRKQLEQQLVQAQEMEVVGQLAGGIAHDFNDLLTVIGGRSALLLGRGGLSEATRRDVELVGKAAERAAGLTHQLLAFSRKQVLEAKPLNLNALVGGVASISSLGQVRADSGQVEQVIMNLVVNARDAMPDGGTVKIETAGRDVQAVALHAQGHVPPGRYVTLSVQDTGLKEQLYKENRALREEIGKTMFEELVGSSNALRRALVLAAIVAPMDSTVLITGETGTGKELVARAIHRRSPRSNRPFLCVNCAAIPPSLIASELFGHEKGAFTGAMQRRLGRFELADGGTILLDEIGEFPAELQIALLRVLQEREFERVGGSQRVSVDVRVLAATNRDLKAAVDAGTFRLDLFYRLNVFPIQIPSLRERVEDIPLLVEYFTERYASKAGKRIRNIDKRTLALLQAYQWPGNIRELQNVVERAVILCDGDTFSVDESWLSPEPRQTPLASRPLCETLVKYEKVLIEAALAETRGQVSGPWGAAAKLGIPTSTLESKIRSLKISKRRFKTV
jgi:PAS domain S-box-containing protein